MCKAHTLLPPGAGDPREPPRWKVIVEDPDGVQMYSGEGLQALTKCTQQFDADEIRAIYIYD